MKIERVIKLEDWLVKPRMVGADYHFLLGHAWLRYGAPSKLQTPLVYAAFEFRCTIERVTFELLILYQRQNLSKADLKRTEGFGELIAFLSELEGKQGVIYKKTRFAQILCEIDNFPYAPAIINLKDLSRYWKACSEFCHKQMSPNETWEEPIFVQRGYKILEEIDSYFENVLIKHKLIKFSDLPQEVADLQDKFIEGKVTEDEAIVRLKLMQPVLQQRMIFRIL